LGDSSTTNKSSPSTTSGNGINWRNVACGADFTAAIKTDGTLWTWGNNQFGPLGDGTFGTSKSSPGTTSGAGSNWKQVSCGADHSAAVKSDGTLWTWGRGNFGALGNGITTSKSSPDTTSGAGTNWASVACGDNHTLALKTDGTLWTWGYNLYGQLGDGTDSATTASKLSPANTAGGGTWASIAAGTNLSAGIKSDGSLWCWGINSNGQLGDGTSAVSRNSPVTPSGGGNNWRQVSMGTNTSAAVKTDGTLWTWGIGTYGTLGDGSFGTSRSSPDTTVGGGTNWKQVAMGSTYGAAIKTDGTLLTWGYGAQGALGDNLPSTSKNSPVTVSGGGTSWKSVSAASQHIAACVDISF
jgi:alpha-tubulin suppressor-like RCC1 family protein